MSAQRDLIDQLTRGGLWPDAALKLVEAHRDEIHREYADVEAAKQCENPLTQHERYNDAFHQLLQVLRRESE